MYFVTSKQTGYLLFCTTANERSAIGLTEKQVVQILEPDSAASWKLVAEWPAEAYSHTDFMTALHSVAEPADARALLDCVPASIRRLTSG